MVIDFILIKVKGGGIYTQCNNNMGKNLIKLKLKSIRADCATWEFYAASECQG